MFSQAGTKIIPQSALSPTQPILVTGATGVVGPRVVAALHGAGYPVRALSRRQPPPGLLPPSVQVIMGDITDPRTVAQAVAGCVGVVHLAALLHVVDPPAYLQPRYTEINVEGTRSLVQAAQAAGVQRLVYASTIAVYAYGTTTLLTETSPTAPDSFDARTKLAAESIVLGAEDAQGRPVGTVLRLAAVYGARVQGNYRRLLFSLARHRFVPLGPGENTRALIYDRDVAAAVCLALTHPKAPGQIYNVSDGHNYPMCEIMHTLCVALGRPAPRFALPVPPIRWTVAQAHGVARLLGLALPITPATLDKYVESVQVDASRIRQELGFIPAHDLLSGWQEAVQELRVAGEL